jgi:hypothetical protein
VPPDHAGSVRSIFTKAWHPMNLYDRAADADLSGLYEFYRLASAVTHGSAAGALGQYQVHGEDGVATYSVGVAPALVPRAFIFGVEAYLGLLSMLWESYPDEVDANDAGSAVRLALVTHIDAIARAAQATTARTSREGTYSHILAFSAGGMRRWYVAVSGVPGVWFRAVDDDSARRVAENWIEPVINSYIEGAGEFNEAGMAAIEMPAVLSLRPDHSKRPIQKNVMPVLWPNQDGTWSVGEEPVEGVMIGTRAVDALVDRRDLAVDLAAFDRSGS